VPRFPYAILIVGWLKNDEMTADVHLTMAELEAGLAEIRRAPKEAGRLELIVRRPAEGARETLDVGVLDTELGLVGDRWHAGARGRAPDPDTQLTLMSARLASLVAQSPQRWGLAGDQLYVDLDLSQRNLPPGTLLQIGDATVQVSAVPHTGCRKFVERFGLDAMLFVNSPVGRALRLRGVNTRVVDGGTISVGDLVRKVSHPTNP
jgi:MOSC domain-containing protein YiiM